MPKKNYDEFPKVVFPERNNLSISINHYGMQRCKPSNRFGPEKRGYYIIHFILKGKGYYYVNGNCFILEENSMFLIRPNEETVYEADNKEPWQYCFIAFMGEGAKEIVKDIGFEDNYVVKYENNVNLKPDFKEICKVTGTERRDYYQMLSKMFLLFSKLSNLNKSQVQKDNITTISQSVELSKAINYIETHYQENITVSDVARDIGFHRSNLYRIFRKELKVSVGQYIIDFKMDKAAFYAINTKFPFKEIAFSLGFEDYVCFYRVFKKKFGYSPTDYRENFSKE